MSQPDPIHLFARMMDRDDDQIGLAEAALVIARTEYPKLDTASELERLDRLAAQVEINPADPPLAHVQALNHLLFEKEKFEGNEEEYDDPENSFLNRVLDRKKGIPITLSLVYTEVAWRKNLPIVGVGFPGHFLVKYLTASAEILVDPFRRGAILGTEDCQALLEGHFGKDTQLIPDHLRASTPKQVLARMLNNLKGSYFRRRNFPKVLLMIEFSLSIDPGSSQDIRDRGMVHLAMRHYREAMADLNAYLKLSPQGDPQAREVLQALSGIRALMN